MLRTDRDSLRYRLSDVHDILRDYDETQDSDDFGEILAPTMRVYQELLRLDPKGEAISLVEDALQDIARHGVRDDEWRETVMRGLRYALEELIDEAA